MPLRPLLAVRLQHSNHPSVRTPEFLALLDSGADSSLFHLEFARLLGIDLAACQTSTVGGVGGSEPTYACQVKLIILNKRINTSVHFANWHDPTIAILGRQDVFNEFKIGLEQRVSRFLLDPY